ncbi:thioredoxin family protein [Halobium salinum]|uniref:Thioredoxin family protein n=1 Tax=Halobium salinum TaxID=1364940 RepID=A0ABD5PAE0_9EURY|nr:thioredoxin family protein [Halobium salinum]
MTDTSQRPKPVALDSRADLDALVADHERVLVEFYTNGCGKCQSMEPVLGVVARQTDATVAMVNARETLDLVEELGFRGVPTFLVYRDGTVVDQLFGTFGAEELVAAVESD